MRTITLIRGPSTDKGIFGKLLLDDGWWCFTGELPWDNNLPRYSCIPTGTDTCHWIDSPKHGMCYQIMDVPDRSMIEIHSANFMGDERKGYVSQLLGCIALGMAIGELDTGDGTQIALLRSKEAIAEFERRMNKEDFQLVIQKGTTS